ncbi:MerR family transcriptional regulator [Paenibacillus lupini]|uniref:MerR family transcriptional regulator n=1 Tax=Paenibacillus lupini TaxID=1450204 RepID=UPI0014212935|nr:MerR family transcriptional regulator [Paenibacillus lupini]NIK21239.1 DNA-binding transcriptional MerR regulator [Paenibacillus lupini]
MYRIGELAKQAGISVRTLQYYDKLGLLSPSHLAENGYRYYSDLEVMTLHHITVLKQLDFTLAQIQAILQDNHGLPYAEQWSQAIRQQIDFVKQEHERLALLDRMLHVSLHTIELRRKIDASELLQFIHSLQADKPSADQQPQYTKRQSVFKDDELQTLSSLPRLDSDDPRNAEWVKLLLDIHNHLDEPPHSEISQHLAERLIHIMQSWFGDNDSLVDKYWNYIRPEDGETEKVLGLDQATMAYIDRIVDYYLEGRDPE